MTQTNDGYPDDQNVRDQRPGAEEQAAQEVHGGCSTGGCGCGVTYRQAPEQPVELVDYIGLASQVLMCDRGDLAAGLVTRLELVDRMVRRMGGQFSSRIGVALAIIGYQDANPHSHLVMPR